MRQCLSEHGDKDKNSWLCRELNLEFQATLLTSLRFLFAEVNENQVTSRWRERYRES
jgi:hypothetical protein